MKTLKHIATLIGIVFMLYCVGTVSVVWFAPESALADQLTGPLTISGALTVYGDMRTTQDLDCDIDLNVDGDAVVDGGVTMAKATTDSLYCDHGLRVDSFILDEHVGAFTDSTTIPEGTVIVRGDTLFRLVAGKAKWAAVALE